MSRGSWWQRQSSATPLPLPRVWPCSSQSRFWQRRRRAVFSPRSCFVAGGLPAKAASDALHIGVAAVHGMDYLVTWNCKHIANARMLRFVSETCRSAGFVPPVICTPEELAEE